MEKKKRAARNRTLTLTRGEEDLLSKRILRPGPGKLSLPEITDRVIQGTVPDVLEQLPDSFVDLLFLDPPYNLRKKFNGFSFSAGGEEDYLTYLESWFPKLLRLLKSEASIYLCGDWRSSAACAAILSRYARIRNRITWQREKGRGSSRNWKNACEDIWFATVSDRYCFHADAVRLRRRVLAPYRKDGDPKDWEDTPSGRFRDTCASNFWDDISVPYWAMPENTDHPTQKPEKLLTKLILSGTDPGGFILDPFLGSGTAAVVSRKLGRHFCGIEQDREYCLWALARLDRAEKDPRIQGYADGVFWERNTLAEQTRALRRNRKQGGTAKQPPRG